MRKVAGAVVLMLALLDETGTTWLHTRCAEISHGNESAGQVCEMVVDIIDYAEKWYPYLRIIEDVFR